MKIEVHKSDKMGNVFRLCEVVRYKKLTVPRGFESDGASVPRLLWGTVFPPLDQRALYAAVIHDYIYRTHPPKWNRKGADIVFFRLLRADNIPYIRAKLAYIGVRLFGRGSWEKRGKK